MTKLFYILLIFCCQSSYCLAEEYKSVLNNFINSYSSKDKNKLLGVLHKDFTQYFRDDITINSKSEYLNNYSHGKVINDYYEIDIVLEASNLIVVKSKYYSDNDSILKVGPYTSILKFYFKNNQIIKIVENDELFINENKFIYERYQEFFEWVKAKHNLRISDFPFSKEGAEKLKPLLVEFMVNRNTN